MNAVGKNLRRLRQRENLTQDALAEQLHVTRQAVSSWETGKTQPDIETLTALAEALHADIRELIYGPEQAAYARFQKRYIACTAACVLALLAWSIMEWTLDPYLMRLRSALYFFRPAPGLRRGRRPGPVGRLPVGGHPHPLPKTAALPAGAGPAGAAPASAVCHSVPEPVAGFYGDLPSPPALARRSGHRGQRAAAVQPHVPLRLPAVPRPESVERPVPIEAGRPARDGWPFSSYKIILKYYDFACGFWGKARLQSRDGRCIMVVSYRKREGPLCPSITASQS